MQVKVHYQGVDHSQWMDHLIKKKVEKIFRYLSPSANIHVHLKFDEGCYLSTITIHNFNHDYAFSGEGHNLYESVTNAVEKSSRILSDYRRKLKDRINKRFTSLDWEAFA